MEIWYLSEDRFKNRIIKRWNKAGTKYNSGNINILRYAFRTVQYWSNLKRNKVSKANKINIHHKLF